MGDVLLKKGTETRAFPEELVPDARAEGWELSGPARRVTGQAAGRTTKATSAAELEVALKSGGRLEAPEEERAAAHRAALERQYGDRPITAAGLGLLSGLTLGGSDLAIEAAGSEEARRLLREVAKRNPKMFMAGQLGSALVPGTSVARGEGILAKAIRFTPAGAATRLAQHAGTAAEKAIQTSLGIERVVSPAARAASLATEAAFEGGLYSMGQTLSDSIVHNKPLSAEAMVSSAGQGVLLGGGIGAGMGAVGGIMARAARRKSLESADDLLGAGPLDLAGKEATAVRGGLRQIGQAHDAVYEKELARIDGDIARLDAATARRHVVGRFKSIPERWESYDTVQQFVQSGLTKEEAKELMAARKAAGKPSTMLEAPVDPSFATRREELVAMREELVAARKRIDKAVHTDRTKVRWSDDALNKTMTHPDDKVWREARGAFSEYQEAVERAAKSLDEAMEVGEAVVPKSTISGARSEGARLGKQLKLLKKQFGDSSTWNVAQAEEVAALEAKVQAATRKAQPLPAIGPYPTRAPAEGLGDLLAEAKRYRPAGLAAEGHAALDLMDAAALADAAGILDVDDVPVVGEAADYLLKGRLLFRHLPLAAARPATRMIAQKTKLDRILGFTRNSVQRSVSINTARGSVFKGTRGQGIVRRLLGDTAAGIQASGTGAVAKELFDDVTGYSGAVAKRTQDVQKKVKGSVDAFMKARRTTRKLAPFSARVLREVTLGPPDKEDAKDKSLTPYQLRERELQRAVANMPVTEKKLHDALAPVSSFDVKLADLMYQTSMRRLNFLAQKLPKNPGIGSQLQQWKDYQPPAYEQMRFSRYVAATEDPLSVLESLETGTITPEEVEALEVVYPELWQYTLSTIIQYLPQLQKQLSYDRKVQLSILFKIPIDSSMRPEFVQSIQAMYAERQAQKQAKQASGPPARPMSQRIAGGQRTETERLDTRG